MFRWPLFSLPLLPFFFSVLLLQLTTPTAAEIVGTWTLHGLTLHCSPDGASCTYNMTLTVIYHDSDDEQVTAQTCSFTVSVPDAASGAPSKGGDEIERASASRTDFQAKPCGDRYLVNGGWHPGFFLDGAQGDGSAAAAAAAFVTLVVTDVPRGANAFFGYRGDEVAEGRVAGPREAPAYRVGTFDADGGDESERGRGSRGEVVPGMAVEKRKGGRGAAGERKRGNSWVGRPDGGRQGGGVLKRSRISGVVGKRDDEGATKNGKEKTWRVEGLTSFPDAALNATDVQLSVIDSETGWQALCSLVVPPGGLRSSWYGKSCGENSFSISWGYNSGADSAVMTVCYPTNGTAAWFGYDNIGSRMTLGDSREEPVHQTGCGG